jgi:isopenicillin N synthase-like dioxygenase|tara:strand:- start:33345 stop:34202 length:858 start_codon:yes stop_codon:yes gene_type:complete
MIPVIDFTSETVLDEIREAYTTVGFAVFTNTLSVVDECTMHEWFDYMKQFFELELETKKKYSYQTENNLGYSIMGAENVDPTAPKDMKESFNYNNTRMPTELWPTEVDLKTTGLETIRIADELTLDILEKFDTILDTGTTLVDAHQDPYNTTRVIHYPAYTGPLEDKQMRIGEHSDYGTITLLWQINDVPGLEVQDLGGAWHPVPYAEDGVVVNIGDLLQRWTNDYFVSTKHRVVNTHIDQTRYSMPHFVDPTPGTIVANLRDEPSKYDPIESKEYLMWRLAQSY